MTFDLTTKVFRPPVTLSQEEIIYQKLGENNISLSTATSSFEKPNDASTRPNVPSQHPSESIESDGNAFDSIERFTTSPRSNGSHSTSVTMYETISTNNPTVTVPASIVFADTQRPSASSGQDGSTKHQTSGSELPQEEPTTNFLDASSPSIVEESVKVTSDTYSDRTSSGVRVSTTTSASPKLPETATKFIFNDDVEAVNKITESPAESPTTVGDLVSGEKNSPSDVGYEMTTGLYTTKTSGSVSQLGSTSSSTDGTPIRLSSEYFSANSIIDRTTVVAENDVASHFQPATETEDHTTEKVSAATEWQDEKATENINTVSDKNTEPSSDQLAEKEQEKTTTTVRQVVISQRTTVGYAFAAEGETKPPESIADKTSVSTVATTSGESEKDATTVTTFVGVPGEGSCLVDGITYRNTSVIESSNPCHSECICLSSIPTCTLVKCSPPPSDPKCMPIQVKPDSCCPIYVCGECIINCRSIN